LTGANSHHDEPFDREDQRREHVRRLLQIPASVRKAPTTLTWKVNFSNIGRGGAAFVTEHVLDVGDDVELSFHLPGNDMLIVVVARVVYSAQFQREGQYRIGARFDRLSDEMANVIVDYVTASAA
jgi:c-di-GMP-binding flagellar brake protein YcgR